MSEEKVEETTITTNTDNKVSVSLNMSLLGFLMPLICVCWLVCISFLIQCGVTGKIVDVFSIISTIVYALSVACYFLAVFNEKKIELDVKTVAIVLATIIMF